MRNYDLFVHRLDTFSKIVGVDIGLGDRDQNARRIALIKLHGYQSNGYGGAFFIVAHHYLTSQLTLTKQIKKQLATYAKVVARAYQDNRVEKVENLRLRIEELLYANDVTDKEIIEQVALMGEYLIKSEMNYTGKRILTDRSASHILLQRDL